ncbi:molecular chaperone Hsp90 [Streptomyces zingiberis]|uniref:Molecular chaperone Hsp90 n=1 Tax=Streptomyces zingiberis TaxID=2053010 RepID=A0ABX1BSC3_9ACTN|nr:molecular chaperone Hsp90 [Streptomyces zingiberis]NJP99962.1 molecular chaperone Hsp90 [Streptomyces zingiberis]
MVRATTGGQDPFGTARLRRGVLDAWAASPARFREDANAEEDLALGGYRDRLVVELAQNAADAASRAGVPGRLRLTLHAGEGDVPAVLAAANTGAPLDAPGAESLATLRASAKRDEWTGAPGGPGEAAGAAAAGGAPGAVTPSVGRFGVGFAAVLAVSDEPAVISRAGGVRWSLAEARDLAAGAAAGSPGLADELRRRDGHVPLLRLPLPAEGSAPAGYDTAVVLPLRDGAAEALAERLLAGIDDALLLTLPGLSEIVVEIPGEEPRTLTRRQEGPYTVVEDSARSTTRWRTAGAGGWLEPALLADRPVEERLRPLWSVTWAVPVDGEGAPVRPGTAPVVHSPTPTEEPLGLPALLIASFPLEPTRRHTAVGPLTDFLVARAAETYAALLRDWQPLSTGTLALVPGPLGKGGLDGRLRAEVLQLLPRVPFLAGAARTTEDLREGPEPADGTGEAGGDLTGATAPWHSTDDSAAPACPVRLRPVDAEVVEGAGADTVAVLAELFSGLLPAGLERRPELRALGVARVPLGEAVDRLAGVERPPSWWRRLYDSLAGTDPERLSGLPVPLADGRTTIGPRQVLLPLPGTEDRPAASPGTGGPTPADGNAPDASGARTAAPGPATLARLGLKVTHPDAAHPLLEKLGALPASPRAVLTTPQVRAAVAASLDSEGGDLWDEDALDAEELAEAVLGLVREAGLAPDDEPWLGALALPDDEGELAPAGELVFPGSEFEQIIREGELAVCDAALAGRWGPQVLAAVGVQSTFALVRATDVVLDPDELEPREGDYAEPDDAGLLDSVDVWCEDVLDRLPDGPVPPVATEITAVRDLDLVDDDAWPRALALLARPPLRDALTTPVRILLPDGTTETVRPYTAWWLRGHPVLDGRRPAGLRAAGGDPLLAGLYDPADAAGFEDEQVLRALGVRTTVAALLDEPGGAAELLTRLADPGRSVTPRRLHGLYTALAALDPDEVTLPDELRAVLGSGGEVRVVDAGEALIADAPDLLAPAGHRPLLPVAPARAADLAELLQVRRLSEAFPAPVADPDAGELRAVPDPVRVLLGPATPESYVEYEELRVIGGGTGGGASGGGDGAEGDAGPVGATVEVDWRRTPDGVVHAATLEGVAAGLAWAAGQWPRRFEVAALLEDLSRTEELARDRWFD